VSWFEVRLRAAEFVFAESTRPPVKLKVSSLNSLDETERVLKGLRRPLMLAEIVLPTGHVLVVQALVIVMDTTSVGSSEAVVTEQS
jgi:hypothetical protein